MSVTAHHCIPSISSTLLLPQPGVWLWRLHRGSHEGRRHIEHYPQGLTEVHSSLGDKKGLNTRRVITHCLYLLHAVTAMQDSTHFRSMPMTDNGQPSTNDHVAVGHFQQYCTPVLQPRLWVTEEPDTERQPLQHVTDWPSRVKHAGLCDVSAAHLQPLQSTLGRVCHTEHFLKHTEPQYMQADAVHIDAVSMGAVDNYDESEHAADAGILSCQDDDTKEPLSRHWPGTQALKYSPTRPACRVLATESTSSTQSS